MFIKFVWCCITILFTSVSIANETGKSEDIKTINFGFSKKLFVDINPTDARAVSKVLANNLISAEKLDATTQSYIYDRSEDIISALERKALDAFALPALEYLEINKQIKVDPIFTSIMNDDIAEQYYLIVHKNSKFNSLSDLANKRIIVSSTYMGDLPIMWLDVMLYKNKLPRLSEFCMEMQLVNKDSKALLPIFFQQKDVCLVSNHGFELMVELNPQLGHDTKIILKSEPMMFGLVCFRHEYDDSKYRSFIKNALATLQDKPYGQQFLGIFKMDRLVPFQPEFIQSVKNVLEEHEKLFGKYNINDMSSQYKLSILK